MKLQSSSAIHSWPIHDFRLCGQSQFQSNLDPLGKFLNIAGEITVAAPREAMFKALSDATPFFACCLEGVRDLKEIDATHYTAVFETWVAYLRFNFKADVEITELSPPGKDRNQG